MPMKSKRNSSIRFDQNFLSSTSRIHLARLLISVVLFFNLQCAIQFLISPASYSSSFELIGLSGDYSIRGMGILFLMWNVPYVFAAIHPVKNITSYLQSLIMQTIGLIGETFLYTTIPSGHLTLMFSISRFILFDGIGLLLISSGYLLLRKV
jgi:hypothetical protein